MGKRSRASFTCWFVFITSQNAALAEESTSAAEQLREQADRLAEMVGRFKLNQQNSMPLQMKEHLSEASWGQPSERHGQPLALDAP